MKKVEHEKVSLICYIFFIYIAFTIIWPTQSVGVYCEPIVDTQIKKCVFISKVINRT